MASSFAFSKSELKKLLKQTRSRKSVKVSNMSTSRGSAYRNRPQKHQNRSAFKNDLHDTSKKTKMLNTLDVSGVCKRCKDIIEWKIKYKKYKPLTAPAKCVGCAEKAVKHAYHVLCNKCAKERQVCAKCCKPANDQELIKINTETESETEDLEMMLKHLPERKRRTVLRHLKKMGETEGKMTPEVKLHIEEMISGMKDINFGDDDDDDDFEFSNEGYSKSNSDDEN